jgi:ribosomal protein L37E
MGLEFWLPAEGFFPAQLKDLEAPLAFCYRHKGIDIYIPFIPIKQGEIFLECNRCGRVFEETGTPQWSSFQPGPLRYQRCGRQMDSDFKFCSYCGQGIL